MHIDQWLKLKLLQYLNIYGIFYTAYSNLDLLLELLFHTDSFHSILRLKYI